MRISFLGAGRWAMTLALILHRKGNEVIMWENSTERLIKINDKRKIADLPDSILIPQDIIVTGDLEQVLQSPEIIFFAVPSQSLREVLIKISPFRFLKSSRTSENKLTDKNPILVSAIKGLENNTNKRISEILKEFYPGLNIVVLAGPGIPYEISEGKPASLVTASNSSDATSRIQELLSYENLRVYTHLDVVGVELGGALKNIIAIAAGICDGLKLGDNAKSALLTRGLAEITRIGIAMNANPMTFAGLSGIGDIIVTSYSQYSRNRRFGEKIAQGTEINKTLDSLGGVAEGVQTTISAKKLGAKMRIETPIVDEIFLILFQNHEITKSIKHLMQRPLKKEISYEIGQ
jgi:glycerol-3-phosphate dehydrogenase (NAD(P)+)